MIDSFRNSLTNPKVSGRLRTRLGIFSALALALCAAVAWDVWRGDATWWSALLALIVGIAVGIPLGRLRTIEWHDTRDEVVSKFDIFGALAILAFIAFDLFRDFLLGHWFSGSDLTTIALALLAGALIGRFFGTHISVQRALSLPHPRDLP